MKQRTYKIGEGYSLEEFLDEVGENRDRLEAKDSLLLVFYPADQDSLRLSELVETIDARLEGTHVVGMTTVFSLGPQYTLEHRIVCSLITFETSRIVVRGYDVSDTGMAKAAIPFIEDVEGLSHLRGVCCLTSSLSRSVLPFVRAVVNDLGVPVFGSIAGIHSTGGRDAWVFADGTIYDEGVVGIAFFGKDLELLTDDNMAWHPIGRQLTITGTAEDDFVVTSIDDQPAISIYEKYLDVQQDESFVENVCAFPFLVDTGDHYVARVPLYAKPDGSLVFSIPMRRGQTVTLSYAKDDYLLGQTNTSANKMADFQAQALLLIPCINRRIFMGNEPADREIGYFARSNPELSVGSGCGEILVTPTGGSVLNSSLVAVGMREGPKDETKACEPFEDPMLKASSREPVPLVSRLATFLEAATYDLEQMANRDQLTGLLNRRRIEEVMAHEFASDGYRDLHVIMYDIDHFKTINDTYGHGAGDIVLRQLSDRVASILRPTDFLARWGGEEFICLLKCTSLNDAAAIAERIRAHVDGFEFDRVGHLTISLGVTEAVEEDTPDSLFDRVDEALYRSKNSGRNCVTVI